VYYTMQDNTTTPLQRGDLSRGRGDAVTSIRLSLDERIELDRLRSDTGKSKTQIIAEAIKLYRAHLDRNREK
jgi:hypothetical protein